MAVFPALGSIDQKVRTALLSLHSRLAVLESGGGSDPAMGGDLTGVASAAQIAAGVIVNADVNASAAIVDTKLATIATANKVSAAALDIDGATDIGGALADADLILVDDGAGGTNRKSALSRIATWLFAKVSSHVTINSTGTATIANGVITNAMLSTATSELGTSWTSWTPTFNNVTGGAATCAYMLMGKTLFFRIRMTAGDATAIGTIGVSLPSGMTHIGVVAPVAGMNGTVVAHARANINATEIRIYKNQSGANWAAFESLTSVSVYGVIEIQ